MTPWWTSAWDGRNRAGLRVGLAVLVALEFVAQAVQLAKMVADSAHYGGDGPMRRLLDVAPWLPWVMLAAILAGLAAVATDRRPVLGGAWALGWMSFLSYAQTELFGSPSRNSFFPGAALLGWVLGLAWARELAGPQVLGAGGRSVRERFAEAGALACIAAGYVGSAASKLLASGFSWADAASVRALVIWQHPLARWPWLLAYRDAVLEQPRLAQAAAVATMIIEGGAFLLLFGARLRLAWAAAIIGLHVNIILLCTMPYLEPMLLLTLFAVPWPRLLRRPMVAAPEPTTLDAPRVPWTMAWVLGALVALGWLLAPLGWRA